MASSAGWPSASPRAKPLSGPLLLAPLAVLPLAFGGVPTLAWAPATALIGLGMASRGAWLLRAPKQPPAPDPLARLAGVLVCLVLAVAVLQVLPGLPGAHPIWPVATTALSGDPPSYAGIAPAAALPALTQLGLVVGAAWLAARGAAGTTAVASVVIGTAALVAAYGLLGEVLNGTHVLWVAKPAYHDVATGPFVNRNAFAAFLGLGLVALAARTLEARQAGRPRRIEATVALAVLLVAGLAASQSRAGLAATAAGLGALLLAHPHIPRRHALAGLGALTLLALLLAAPRLATLDLAVERRLALYDGVLDAIALRPLLGHGPGGFEAAWRLVQPADVARRVTQAHSAYLHAIVVLGLPAAGLLLAAFGLLLAASLRGLRRGRPGAAAGVGAGVLVAAHGAVDFAPQTPGVALAAAALLGAGACCRNGNLAPPPD